MPAAFELRSSAIHGHGVFAVRRIHKGKRLIEYIGERITPEAADLRYDDDAMDNPHTFLFTVDAQTIIDAAVGGNEARFINHSCDPNCESLIDDDRVFIEAIRTIRPGEEITYDYQIGRDRADPPDVDDIFACRCGAHGCRGSMLWPPRRRPREPRRATRRAGKNA